MSSPGLKGMTWSHPRGYDPMVACSRLWREKTGVEITWDQRSPQDFESAPLEELSRRYDLIVIDHPHVGRIAAHGGLEPLDMPAREDERRALGRGSVGPSCASYEWKGRQWALPVDAAAQVQAWRPDLLAAPTARWQDVVGLAREGMVALPLKPPHSLMCFYTLAANLGTPCRAWPPSSGCKLIEAEAGERVFAMISELAGLVDPACLEMDPIAVLGEMAGPGSRTACAPLLYGYVSYAVEGFRPHRVAFADLPAAGTNGPVGSALGGAGIAVSAFSKAGEAAVDFAYWIASGEVQRGPYAGAGGQPAHAHAWEDDAVDTASGGFYRATRATLEGAWLRPRHDGYVDFQRAAAERLNDALACRHSAGQLVSDLNRLFAESF